MRKVIVGLLVIIFLVCLLTPVYASEPDESTAPSESQSFFDMIANGEDSFGGLSDLQTDTSALSYFDSSWDTFSLSDSDSVWGQLQFDIPTTVGSVSSLNYQYESMLAKYSLAGYKTDFALEMPTFEFGYSYDLETQFQSAYGGLMQDFSLSASLPEGWSMDSIMSSASQMRSAANSNFLSSNLYTSVMSGISYESPIDKMAELAHTESYKGAVKTKLNELDAKISPEWNASVSANKESVMAEGEALNHPLITEGVTIEFNVEKQMSELRERANEVAELEQTGDVFENLSQYQMGRVSVLCDNWDNVTDGIIAEFLYLEGDMDVLQQLRDCADEKDRSISDPLVMSYIDDHYETIEAEGMYEIGAAIQNYADVCADSNIEFDLSSSVAKNLIEGAFGMRQGWYDNMLESGYLEKSYEYYQNGDYSLLEGKSTPAINSGRTLFINLNGYGYGE